MKYLLAQQKGLVMHKHFIQLVASAMVMIGVGCVGGQDASTSEASTKDSHRVQATLGSDVRPVMQQKLLHAQGLLQSIVREEFESVQTQARVLSMLSSKADWKVHHTLQYLLLSDQFKSVCEDMSRHAKKKNIEAVTLDYMHMVMTCVKCHQHMRLEGLAQNHRPDVGVLALGLR
jgi:hypothetical protein